MCRANDTQHILHRGGKKKKRKEKFRVHVDNDSP